MARVFVDVGVFGEAWFSKCVEELLRASNVRFAYSPVNKLLKEHERALKVKQFYKLAHQMGKRDDADPKKVKTHMDYLENSAVWLGEKDCDDPHIFALAYEKPFDYVITKDADIANCRKCLNKAIDKKYCQFRLICNSVNYDTHKAKVFA